MTVQIYYTYYMLLIPLYELYTLQPALASIAS